MLVAKGDSKMSIKKYTDNQHPCKSCNAFDMEVKVYRDYYHIYFVPIYPIADKTVKMHCKSCGEPFRSDKLQAHYASITKTPFYLYTGLILIALAVLSITVKNIDLGKTNAKMMSDPQVGDVYTVKKKFGTQSIYSFLKVMAVDKDTIHVYHNNLDYYSTVSKFNTEDYFMSEEEMLYPKTVLKKMYDDEEITAVTRQYTQTEGFERMK